MKLVSSDCSFSAMSFEKLYTLLLSQYFNPWNQILDSWDVGKSSIYSVFCKLPTKYDILCLMTWFLFVLALLKFILF